MHYLCLHYRQKAAGQHVDVSIEPCDGAGGVLGDDDSSVVVRIDDGVPRVFDVDRLKRPDQLAQYWIIEARDLNDAIRIGSRILAGSSGYLEVRPIISEFDGPRHVTGATY